MTDQNKRQRENVITRLEGIREKLKNIDLQIDALDTNVEGTTPSGTVEESEQYKRGNLALTNQEDNTPLLEAEELNKQESNAKPDSKLKSRLKRTRLSFAPSFEEKEVGNFDLQSKFLDKKQLTEKELVAQEGNLERKTPQEDIAEELVSADHSGEDAYLPNTIHSLGSEASSPERELEIAPSHLFDGVKLESEGEKASDLSVRNTGTGHVVWNGLKRGWRYFIAHIDQFQLLSWSLVGIVIAVYFMSPFSKAKETTVVGGENFLQEDIVALSGIKGEDYILTTFKHKDAYARNLAANSLQIKSATVKYQFPNRFTITLTENPCLAYIAKKESYYPLLEDGTIDWQQKIPLGDLPDGALKVPLSSEKEAAEFAGALAKSGPDIRSKIQEVSVTPTKTAPDMLTLTMLDGNEVKVPVSKIVKNLPYYDKVAERLETPSIIDMEIGIYSYPK